MKHSNSILKGVRVLDISSILAAPLATNLLGDFGAEVIKIELPNKGDATRHWDSYLWKVTNRNKKCITLDFHKRKAKEIFYKLVEKSDIVVTNFRPETLKKWSIDYEDIVKVKSDIVMLHFSAFGRTGELTNHPGFARVAEGYSGLMYMTGNPDEKPMPSGYAIADGLGGVYAAFSIMLAFYHYKQTGEGQLVDLSLYEPMFRIMEDFVIDYDVKGRIKERVGTYNPALAPNDLYKTKDNRWIILPASTDNMYKRLMKAMEKEELIDDPRFNSNDNRVKNREELDNYLNEFFLANSYNDLEKLLTQYKVAFGPVNTIRDIVEDSHYLSRDNLLRVYDEKLERNVTVQGIVPKMSKTPGEVKWLGPDLGEHNEEVYKNLLSLTDETLADLENNDII